MNRSGLTLLSLTALLGSLLSSLPAKAQILSAEDLANAIDLPVFNVNVDDDDAIENNSSSLSRADDTALQLHRQRALPVLEAEPEANLVEDVLDTEAMSVPPAEETPEPNLDVNMGSEIDLSPAQISAAEYYNQGIRHYNKGEYALAVTSFNAAIAANSEYAEAYVFRAAAKSALNDPAAAMADYATAIYLQPDYAVAYFSRGALLADMGELATAMEDFEQAIALRPTYVEAHDYLGLTKAATGDHEAALVSFESALSLDVAYAPAHMHRGASLIELGEFETAIAALSTAIDLDSTYTEAFLNRGVAHYRLGNLSSALDVIGA
ncbi:MAG: tetratricopeptide repeat protein, partial [Cyanobacteria bacterium J06554_11]